MISREHNWVEGPLIRFAEADKLELRYLFPDGVQEVEKTVSANSDLIKFKGAFKDEDHTYLLSRRPRAAEAVQQGVGQILLLGDIHGHYHKLITFLRVHGIIDTEYNWQWGEGHLVMCGDVMDRGLLVLPLQWFLCRLEQQAAEAGGAVHVLLGNHELMVMQGDYRYVHPQLMRLYTRAGMSYSEAYSKHWYLGQWLRSRNAVIKINDLLISHAGVSPAVAGLGLNIAEINEKVRASIGATAPDKAATLLLGNQGPLWYRGYVLNNAAYRPASVAEADSVLAQYGASSLVVAHTPVAAIQQRLHGRVWAVDLDIESPKVAVQGLLYKYNEAFLLKADGSSEKAANS